MDQVLLMHFSRNFLMSCVKRKVLVFWTWELGVFTKFIMHTKQWWKNWNLTLISLLLAFILFSNFQLQDEKTTWEWKRFELYYYQLHTLVFSMNYRSCKHYLINSALPNKYKITVKIWQLFGKSYWWMLFAIDPICYKMYNKVQVTYILNFFFYNVMQNVFDIIPKGVRIREDHSGSINSSNFSFWNNRSSIT